MCCIAPKDSGNWHTFRGCSWFDWGCRWNTTNADATRETFKLNSCTQRRTPIGMVAWLLSPSPTPFPPPLPIWCKAAECATALQRIP